jgi:hypothetical protein
MKQYGVALLISVGMGVILFAVLYLVFHNIQIAEGVGALPITGCHRIAEMLERRETRAHITAHGSADILTLKGFAITWPIIVLYGTLGMCAVDIFAGVFGGVTIAIVDAVENWKVNLAAQVAAAPIELVGAFMVGQWIGIRSEGRSHGIVLLVAIAGALLSTVLGETTDWSTGGSPSFANTWIKDTIIFTGIAFVQLAIGGLVGNGRGRNYRLAAYMDYLLSVLPPETRNALVDLAYEEARKATSTTV